MTLLVLDFFLSVDRVSTDLFVVLLKGGKILASLRELAFFHTFSDVPVNESTLGVHEVELVVETTPGGRDGSGVGQHAQAAADLGEVTTRDIYGGLVADTEFETSRAPVDKLDSTLGLNDADGSVDVLGNNITTVKQTASHIFSLLGITLDHLITMLKARISHIRNRIGLMGRLLSRE